jgi:predicted small lipoprotein YifL
MKLHRFLPAVLLALTLLAFLSACGGKGGGY